MRQPHNIYINGYGSGSDFLIKYDNQGAFIWARFIEEINGDMITSWSRAGQGLAVDSFENIYVIGRAPNDNYYIVRFNHIGEKNWTHIFSNLNAEINEASGINIDKNGDLFITGNGSGSLNKDSNLGGTDFFIVKYDLGSRL